MRPGFVPIATSWTCQRTSGRKGLAGRDPSELKAAPFAVKKMAEQSRRFGLGELERALLELSQLNIEIRLAAGSLKSWKKY